QTHPRKRWAFRATTSWEPMVADRLVNMAFSLMARPGAILIFQIAKLARPTHWVFLDLRSWAAMQKQMEKSTASSTTAQHGRRSIFRPQYLPTRPATQTVRLLDGMRFV